MRRGRLLVPLVVAAVLMGGVVMWSTWAERPQHARDVDAFRAYVVKYILHPGTRADKNWATEHPEEVLGEGSRACDWLSRRAPAPDLDHSGASTVHNLANAYLEQAREEPEVPLTREGHRTIVAGAWAYLCWWERRDKSAPMSEYED